MNIFYLATCPNLAAKLQCDKHVVKMPLESAQMLCAVAHRYGLADIVPGCYKLTHANHPSTIWAGNNINNFRWLIKHAIYLCMEYKHRYGRTHKSSLVITECANILPHLPAGEFTPPPQCMPDEYKHLDPVRAYQQYYYFEKSRIADYAHSARPAFMTKEYWPVNDPIVGQCTAPERELPARVYSTQHDLTIDINATDVRHHLAAELRNR